VGDDRDIDVRHLAHPQRRVVAEVADLQRAVLERRRLEQRERHAHRVEPSICAFTPSGLTTVPRSIATVSFLTSNAPFVGLTSTTAAHAVQVAVARSWLETQAMPRPVFFGSSAAPQPARPAAVRSALASFLAPPLL